ncbi:ATP-binding protein [Ramlibacter tataouinensis]|uniref:hybrid sensor histidine kinase/response regulator n=1 Tax=Ramlibacter tataouinensis TaxID=94132 RepID=UPI0022F39C18|nr:ATP-binding protein [Ramlibacter tataouinensis]WBY01453.1 ATP-binding protein [Ramlibacter tataouinensis]
MASYPPAIPADEQRRVLGRAARLLAGAADFDETLRQAIAACLPALADFGCFDTVIGDDDVRRTCAAHEDPGLQALLATTRWVRRVHPEFNLCALSTGEPALHPDTDDRWYRRAAASDQHLQLLRRLAFRSMLTVPVRWRGELMGALTLFMGRSGRRHTGEHLAFAAELAELAAPLVANARLLERQRRVEVALRHSEERLRMAVEAGEVGIWDWDIVSDRVNWSERVYQMHQMPAGSDIGGVDGFRSHVLPDDLPRVEAAIGEALAGGAPYAIEFRTPLPDGRVRWIATQSQLVRDGSGRPLRMVGASTDVTQRVELLAAERRARSEAEAARRRMELLAAAGERLARSLDPQATLEAVARTLVPDIADWCRIDLLDEHGVLQRKLAWHSDPQRSQQALELAGRLRARPDAVGSMAWVVRTGRPHHGDLDAAQRDPAMAEFTRAFGMHSHFILPLVAHGRTIGAMGVLQAESGRKLDEDDRALVLDLGRRAALALDNARLFAEGEAARKQAEAANGAKDEFLAMLGHELRNPLAPISTALQLMARREPDAAVQERRVIGRQVDHLSRLIDDLLDISRITRGKVQLRRERVDLRAVVAHALELTRPVYAVRPQPVQVQLPQGPALVDGDFVRLSQVLCNLLVNAAKFTPPAGVVALRLRQRGNWEIEVSDTGCGIAPELLARVFDQFVQGPQPVDRRAGGLGLGLAIVRSMVERHGGTARAHSEGEGHGAAFTVTLPPSGSAPLPAPTPAPAPAPVGEHRGSGRILVVDDNADAAQTLAELLEVIGYEARTAGEANAALQVLKEFRPQLALLDIGLPQVDGYELAGLIRQQPEGRDVRLVALTGYGQESDRARALASHFDEHLVKPVSLDLLTEVLQRLLG